MHTHPRRQGLVVLVPLVVAALLAVFSVTAAVAAVSSSSSHLAGKWSGKYSGAYSGTFTLRWTQTGSKLRGSIALSNPRARRCRVATRPAEAEARGAHARRHDGTGAASHELRHEPSAEASGNPACGMGREGFEPSTLGLRVPCSTN